MQIQSIFFYYYFLLDIKYRRTTSRAQEDLDTKPRISKHAY
jgi:hypothetical protein